MFKCLLENSRPRILRPLFRAGAAIYETDHKNAIVLGVALVLTIISGHPVAADWTSARQAYERGDFETAAREFQELAERGDPTAQYDLAIMYEKGQGMALDYAEAAKWYRLAAEQGHTDAQDNLGYMYATGRGVTRDLGEAVKWIRLSAEHGNALAQYNLGAMYANGIGLPQDYVMAYMWFELAASGGDKQSRTSLKVTAGRMNPEQLEEAQRLAREWKPR